MTLFQSTLRYDETPSDLKMKSIKRKRSPFHMLFIFLCLMCVLSQTAFSMNYTEKEQFAEVQKLFAGPGGS